LVLLAVIVAILITAFKEKDIAKVAINGQSFFNPGSEFPYNADIVIYIHQKKEIMMPFSSSSFSKLNYSDVCNTLSALGFTDIYTAPINDLVTGFITKDGSVDSVLIKGVHKFKKGMMLRYDVKLIVYYHTFKKPK